MASLQKKLGQDLGLARDKGVYYGVAKGYPIWLIEGNQQLIIGVSAGFESEERREAALDELAQSRQTLKMTRFTTGQGCIVVSMPAGLGARKRIDAFFEWLWPWLARHGASGDICPLCGGPLSGSGSWARVDGDICRAHSACIERRIQESQAANTEAAAQKKRTLPGALGALLGAIVGSIPWVIASYIGYYVAVLGLLIGMASKKGYELLGGRPSKAKMWLVLLSVILAVFLTPVIEMAAFFFMEYDVPISYLPGFIGPIIADVEYFWLEPTMIGNLALGLLFAGLGCMGVIAEVRQEAKGPGARVEYLGRQTADV